MRDQVTFKSFEGQSFFIGIDVHKKSWKVTILNKDYELKNFSQNANALELVKYLNENYPGGEFKLVYEAGFCGFNICREFLSHGLDCQVIHPADVPTSLKDRQQKTDKIDSRNLAKSLRAGILNPIDIPSKELEADRALIRQRFTVVKDIARYKNRVKSLLYQFGIEIPFEFDNAQSRHWSKRYIEWLQCLTIKEASTKSTLDNYIKIGLLLRKELLNINRQIRELSRTERYKEGNELLIKIPGIGLIVSMTLLTHLGDLKRFKRLDELCNFVGLVPSMHGSGEKMRTGKLIKRGRKQLKIMLIEASWIAIRKDPALLHKFTELSCRMNKNKAIIRIARKMLNRIKRVLIYKEPYELGVIK
ncbi:MAG: IS110 family transposase [Saprospiraceae bacterium]